ncbi:SusD/RagB family nutrient-binding outer membrane lipoprotein [Hymenobacter crusticola]|uniref:SusD/RagB family nutrient-binding outer membrane lipoprotein n=1 Tax=Hymenobacter crusticola TaxID=1770526 RepID=A0A243W7C1_9BACT|nr:SusD/RagB family nutrient-binding outer membrane lipoprotein [Hymenobacter crusticola]OUJ70322.1 hypothetical protein BXP70_24805 [Hymenobacter crusticola]
MKKTLLFCIPALLLATSCSKLDELDNINPKAASTIPSTSLVSNAQRMLANTVATPDYNLNPFRLYVQYWAETTYPDESQYNIEIRTINRFFWDPLYRDVLSDLNEAKKLITADPLLSVTDPVAREKVRANQLASVEVLQVYAWMVLVDTFGDIPYSEALDIDKLNPKFDDDAAIYNDLSNRLNTAIGQFDAANNGLGSADLYYKGSTANWIKFANSLKLRLGITLADVDAAKAKTLVEAAAPNVFTASTDDAKLTYLSGIPNASQLWVSLVNSGRADFVGANTFVDRLNALNDPRISTYFKPVGGVTPTTYKGGTYGAPNSYEANSAPGTVLEDPTFPATLLSYTEVQFLLAEAVERGFAVGGTAASHYNTAVTNSIVADWKGTAASAATYLAQPNVAYATAGTSYKQKIGVQKWIALYNEPVESWKEWRRLDSPTLVKPAAAISDIPLRLTYPTTEANLNGANYNAAATAIGGDVVTSKIFWDKF